LQPVLILEENLSGLKFQICDELKCIVTEWLQRREKDLYFSALSPEKNSLKYSASIFVHFTFRVERNWGAQNREYFNYRPLASDAM
jgi:hypothetical protein